MNAPSRDAGSPAGPRRTPLRCLVLVVALCYPTLLTLVYFKWLQTDGLALQRFAYGGGKCLQFALPLAAVAWIWKERCRPERPSRDGLAVGLAFGLLVAALMLGLYHLALKPLGTFEIPGQNIRERLVQLQLDARWKFIAVGCFYALIHSLLEEYYWRWFVFGRLREWVRWPTALAISGVGFMAHHVVLLETYFGWRAWETYVFSAAVAVGGFFWAWLYQRSRSLYGPWASHLVIDAAIFMVGYDVAASLF